MKNNTSENYAKELYEIKENIVNKSKDLNNENYADLLENEFGYKREKIKSRKSDI